MRLHLRGGESPEDNYKESIRQQTEAFDLLENGTNEYSRETLNDIFDSFTKTLKEGVDKGFITSLGRFTYLRDIASKSGDLAERFGDSESAALFQGREESYADICLVMAGEPPIEPTVTTPSHMSGRKQ